MSDFHKSPLIWSIQIQQNVQTRIYNIKYDIHTFNLTIDCEHIDINEVNYFKRNIQHWFSGTCGLFCPEFQSEIISLFLNDKYLSAYV